MGSGEEGVWTTTELVVVGMHCGSCVALVKEELEEHPGVASAEVDLDTGRAAVRHDPDRADLDVLVQLVEAAGYRAEAAQPSC